MTKVQVGDKIGLDGSRGYNHGCRDSAVFEYIGDNKAKTIEASNCTSCWQVGHDQDHVFATIGEVISITATELAPASWDTWSADVTWEIA